MPRLDAPRGPARGRARANLRDLSTVCLSTIASAPGGLPAPRMITSFKVDKKVSMEWTRKSFSPRWTRKCRRRPPPIRCSCGSCGGPEQPLSQACAGEFRRIRAQVSLALPRLRHPCCVQMFLTPDFLVHFLVQVDLQNTDFGVTISEFLI